jgi:hypothetical protein
VKLLAVKHTGNKKNLQVCPFPLSPTVIKEKQTNMKKFIVIYHAPANALKQMAKVPKEQQAKGMEGWMKWAKKCGDKLVDMGAPLMGGQQVNPDGTGAASRKGVCGYSVLQAKNMKGALALLKGHPHLGWNAACSIEVHETMPLPGM